MLSHLGITGKPLSALEAHASERAVLRIVERLRSGEDVAFVTDAGMPAVSDPGSALVRRASEAGVPVVVIPGPSAVTAAAALSGLVDAPFRFVGFLARRGTARAATLVSIAATPEPVILFEAPSRVAATLVELARQEPDRSAVVCRELTKVHEEAVRGTLAELAALDRDWRGELTLVLGPSQHREREIDDGALDARIAERLAEGASAKDVASELAAWSGRPRRDVYARALRIKQGLRS